MSASDESSPARMDPAGARVTVVGLGRFGGGVGVTRWLAKRGAKVTVSDKAGADELAASVAKLDGVDVTLHLGEHRREDFLEADLLVVNPAVPDDLPPLVEAAQAGVPRTTEMNLFLARCPATVIGVTGSVGKSTTTAMLGQVLSRVRTTHVGGNIGVCLLEELDRIGPDDYVVLELSSFQLDALGQVAVAPHIAVVTNLSPNHLDRHGSMEAYAAAKKNIFRFQRSEDVLVLNAACEATRDWAGEAPGRVEWFDPVGEPFELAVPGAHNQANAQAAWKAAEALGVDRPTARAALKEFRGLPHRLELVAERDGVRYVNDSKCTTPGGTIVALEAFEPRRAVVLCGGYDKGVSFDELGAALAKRAKAVVAFGATAEKILAALQHCGGGDSPAAHRADDLPSAVAEAQRLAETGDVILLSPACASYDMFTNYEQRGTLFTQLAQK
ncbi:MAG: UDP-N-acetylmuramoyl-L-alanine--D-glutamate ligase [Phycisphaerae bacterium]